MSNEVDFSQLVQDSIGALGNPTLLCVLGSHLLIHLREAAEEGRNEGTSYRLSSFSAIEFEQGAEMSDLGMHSSLLQHWKIF